MNNISSSNQPQSFLGPDETQFLDSQLSQFLQCETQTQFDAAPNQDANPDLDDLDLDSLLDCYECLELLQRVFPIEMETEDQIESRALLGKLVNERYEILSLIGSGGFGTVYRARDVQLQRDVALKVMKLADSITDFAKRSVLAKAEARTVARLKHPNIVRVFDIGSSDDIPLYMVSELIVGQNLSQRALEKPFSIREAVTIAISIANALDYSHSLNVIHRDVKPANILLDANGIAHLTDFGLAVTTSKVVNKAGSPHYMSPEQFNEQVHRIDPRSDIYSLGVTLYELLAGGKPFPIDSYPKFSNRISKGDFLPLSLLIEDFPLDLERIQKTAMAVRKSDRYPTAGEMVAELSAFLESLDSDIPNHSALGETKVVPQGLRPFSNEDADFFLQLLPGVCDKNGIPRGIRFWQSRIEQANFEVGVLFGPSGCGKSSFVKAGLIPSLSANIKPIYVEATANGTAQQTLLQLKKQVDLPPQIDTLSKAIRYLCRESESNSTSVRYLIILDQFEQWLHSRNKNLDSDLIAALENCNGRTVISILMIRDDYWMDLTRLMSELDIPIVEGGNSAAVDLFDLDHARKVLRLFGHANGDLPDADKLSLENLQFIDQAIDELQSNNRVICVQLALFSQMVRGRSWSPETLSSLSGSSGVGVMFLEQTFGERATNSIYRQMAEPAKQVLAALLPNAGSEIKGSSKSPKEIQNLTGLDQSSVEDLLKTLDQKLKLITSVTAHELDSTKGPTKPTNKFQLAHDFLVPVLREWIYRTKRQSAAGRAELCLVERESLWKTEPVNRFLPSLTETIEINRLTQPKSWTPSQRQIMRAANRYYALRGLAIFALAAISFTAFFMIRSNFNQQQIALEAEGKVETLLSANPSDVPRLIEELVAYKPQATPLLEHHFEVSTDKQQRLHSALALTSLGSPNTSYLQNRLLQASPEYAGLIRKHKSIFDSEFEAKLWKALEHPESDQQILLSASALAVHQPDAPEWEPKIEAVAAALVRQNPLNVIKWMELLRPVRAQLSKSLSRTLLSDSDRHIDSESQIAASVLLDFASDNPRLLFQILQDCTPDHFLGFFQAFSAHGETARQMVTNEIKTYSIAQQSLGENQSIEAIRRANVCLLALKLDRFELVKPFLQNSIDNSVRTEIIHSVSRAGVDGSLCLEKLNTIREPDVRISLLLCLGELIEILKQPQRDKLQKLALNLYELDPHPGVHAACFWLLSNRMNQPDLIKQMRSIESRFCTGRQESDRQWFITKHDSHHFAVIESPDEFWMGSTPETSPDRDADETRRKRFIPRSFAIGQFEVSVKQFRKFWDERPDLQKYYSYPEEVYSNDSLHLSAGRVNWYLAAEFCNWLSEKEGFPEDQWCFPKEIDRSKGITISKDYFKKTGYRLLSETEWEYACRNGTLTKWHFGHSLEQLSKYSWWTENSDDGVHSPGRLKPNNLGLFDLYGNTMEWTASGQQIDAQPASIPTMMGYEDSNLLVRKVTNDTTLILKGGCFEFTGRYNRSSHRAGYTPDGAGIAVGFRIGRTILKDE